MSVEHFDVLVVGAGLSGIGAGYHLQTYCPGKRYAILEGRENIGGTWDLFRYPGIRSDSDMHTLGYSFRPWRSDKSIADGPSILQYVRNTAREYGIDRHIRFNHRVQAASWSSETACWTVEAETGAGKATYTCRFLYLCSGYYSYEAGHAPSFPGVERFRGQRVHPQHWPEDLDYTGKRVVVIGSGATAVTLVPAMAEKAEHVTMLQRSPTYIVSLPSRDRIANALRRRLPEKLAHSLSRWKNILMSLSFYQFCRRAPGAARRLIQKGIARQLPGNYPVAPDFDPNYKPWDQRLCVVPDGDLFKSLRRDRASIVTDHIDTFTEKGIRLKSGEELEADIVVTATGLKLIPCGGIRLEMDGRRVDPGETYTYKGLMLSGVPNFALCVGYINSSWTLRADLTSLYVTRLLNHMDRHGYTQAKPLYDQADQDADPLINLSAGYVQRSVEMLPKQGAKSPWKLHQNYLLDMIAMKFGRVDDGAIEFSREGADTGYERFKQTA